MCRVWMGLALAVLGTVSCRAAERADRWREDLAVFRRELPARHKNLYHALSRQDFETAVDRLAERLPALSDPEIVVELARIVARVGDGHTFINLADPALGYHVLPLRLYLFADGLYVTAAARDYAALVGKRLTAIGGVPAAEALRRAEEVTSRDNESGLKAYAVLPLVIPEILAGLGIVKDAGAAALTVDDDGRPRSVVIKPVTLDEAMALPFVDARAAGKPPLYLSDTNGTVRLRTAKSFWFEYLPEPRLLYVKFNAVNWSDGTSPAGFFDQVFAFADAHPIDKLVIDLRHNSGGDNTLILPIIHGIIKRDAINQPGKLFAIIGRETFSAAQNFVNHLEKHTHVLFAGEPSGGTPNHYGDPVAVTLPNSRLTIRVSTLWWQDLSPTDTRPATLPQIAVEPSFADYRDNRDPVLEAVTSWRTLTARLTAAQARGGEAALADEYRDYRADPRHRYQDTEGESETIAAQLLRDGRTGAALALCRLNVASYPGSADAHGSLGDAYAAAGRKDAAAASYEKALALNPRDVWVRKKLADLQSGPP
jgi:tetratricopeptide repeat protein